MISGRKDCRSGAHPCNPKTKREALYCQGTHAEMGRTAIAEAMDVNPSTLGKWLDPQEVHERIPDERLEHLLRLTDDNPVFVRYFANLQGFVVYDPKQLAGKQVARMVSEFGDLLKALDALADGATVEDAERIEKEGHELIAVVQNAIEQAKREANPVLRAVK